MYSAKLNVKNGYFEGLDRYNIQNVFQKLRKKYYINLDVFGELEGKYQQKTNMVDYSLYKSLFLLKLIALHAKDRQLVFRMV